MRPSPVRLTARPDEPGRWLWLVKWLLLIPHYIVLAVLWVAFVALTLVAYVAVLLTGRYPAGIHEFNVGVLRWTWRVGYYGYAALGTDRYPPFTLDDVPDYPARIEADRPERLPRWLPLVAWLFAVPHLVIVGLLTGGGWPDRDGGGGSLIGFLVLVVGIVLLATGRYPRGLFNLVVGINRWAVRTVAYVALLTDRYPPFRLDQGGAEPVPQPPPPTPSGPAAGEPVPPRTSGRTAGRVVSIVAGVLLLVAGLGAAAGGVTALAVHASRDSAGFVSSDELSLSTATAAVTVEGIEIHPLRLPGRDRTALDAVRIRIDAGNSPMFVGVGPESAIDAWLAGTAHDEVTGVYEDSSDVTTQRSAGAVRAIDRPAAQSFWLASATGTGTLDLRWTPGDGRFAMVLTNADGTTGVTAGATVGAKVPALRPLGNGLIGGGVVAILVALLLIYVGAVGLAGGPGGGRRPVPPAPGPAPENVGPPTVVTRG
ncbi:DUF4389 domain-containing protein [Virgisporangium ochraceum]|uniref:DUF4389 domain-containing protein n=1 Tax=Virgisporangium ochraceum TaxID=65505 RepID=A0A8J4EH11_9ACTN|nr:DUF4389 domain-containing protein [Virgisporangium ochraceum]GIJ71712.1 hypothetical protein Voc01_066290 [Virgisporangium ochraceum]